jgi:hypothetical protein
MWFAVAILGVIAIATGITLLPGAHPAKAPTAMAAPTAPAPMAPATPSPAQAPPAPGK